MVGSAMAIMLNGSGGGKWIDISSSGLPQVGYIRFSIADDGNSGTSLNFDLDAVSISHAALGDATVPEPATILLITALLPVVAVRRRLRYPQNRVDELSLTTPTRQMPE